MSHYCKLTVYEQDNDSLLGRKPCLQFPDTEEGTVGSMIEHVNDLKKRNPEQRYAIGMIREGMGKESFISASGNVQDGFEWL